MPLPSMSGYRSDVPPLSVKYALGRNSGGSRRRCGREFGAGGILVTRDALRRSGLGGRSVPLVGAGITLEDALRRPSLGGRSVPLVSAGNALEESGGSGGRSGRVKGRIQKVAEAVGAFPPPNLGSSGTSPLERRER